MTLGATTLLHEAYLDISARERAAFPDRNRFMAYASRVMRGLILANRTRLASLYSAWGRQPRSPMQRLAVAR